MPLYFSDFDDEKVAFFNPNDIIARQANFPRVAVTTFSADIVNDFVQEFDPPQIARIYTANGCLPVYQTEYKGEKIALFVSRVGAPACVAGLEEIIQMGADNIVMFGCCGVLNDEATKGKIILPSAAIRDEGTSQFYLPYGEEIAVDERSIEIAQSVLSKFGIPYVKGKIWTTDAVYRETSKLIAKRKEQGCLAVDMECSVAISVAQFRGIRFIPFLFGADNLDGEEYEIKDLISYGRNSGNKYLTVALEFGVKLING